MANILLIEPDRVLAEVYGQALRQAGHEVRHAESAQAAIHAADAITPDIVLLELQLIGHDGIEFLQEFRSYSDWQEVPVVVLSLLARTASAALRSTLGRDFGVTFCLYKPRATLKQIIGTVQQALQEARKLHIAPPTNLTPHDPSTTSKDNGSTPEAAVL